MSNEKPIHIEDKSVLISVTSTSSATALSVTKSSFVTVKNIGTSTAFVSTGGASDTVAYPATGTATSGSFIAAGEVSVFRKETTDAYFLAICNTAQSTTLIVQAGEGV